MKKVKKNRHIWLKIGISILILIVVGIVSLVLIGSNLRTNRPSSSEASSEAPSSSEVVESSSEVPSSSEVVESSSEITSSSEVKTYTIQWVNYDDEILEVDSNVKENTLPTYDGATPLREKDAQFIYTFDTWTPKVTPATEDKTYKATYSKTTVGYDIVWKNYDGEVLEYDKDVPYGTTPTYDGELPKKESNAQAHYVFDGWTPEIKPVTKKETYTATFKAKTRGYTVTWVDFNDAVLEKDENVLYGETPSFDKDLPTRPKTDQYSYTFKGWTPEIKPVCEDVTYKATYTSNVNTFKVKWVNYDDTLLEIDEEVPYDSLPKYNGKEPERASKNGIAYKFNGWSPLISPVKADVTYKAQYKELAISYTVTWVNYDDTVLEIDENVAYNQTPSYDGELPTREKTNQYTYTFKEWSPKIKPVTENVTYKATFNVATNKYNVSWVDYDDTLLDKEEYDYGALPTFKGETPKRESSESISYTFDSWSPKIETVTKDVIYKATYKETTYAFTITWVNYDDTVLEIDENVPKGTMPTYDGTTPLKPSNKEYYYLFDGWYPQVNPVTSDMTYKATYTSYKNGFTIRWTDYKNLIIETDYNVGYLTTPSYDGETPTKPSDNKCDYIFIGWDPEIKPVTKDVTYYPVFKEILKSYKVTWVNYDGTVLEVDEKVEYGKTPTYDGVLPTREGVHFLSFEFDTWTPEVSTVSQNVTYKAKFKTNDANWFYYGSYPAKEITDYDETAEMSKLIGETPTDFDLKGWKKISAYNKGSVNSNAACYKDIIYNGRKVRVTKALNDFHYNEDIYSGFYYFEFSDITWTKITPVGVDPIYMSSEIIENHYFNATLDTKEIDGISYAPYNYHASDLNIWLNSTFMNNIFSNEKVKDIIGETPFNEDDEVVLKDNASSVYDTKVAHKEKLFILGDDDLYRSYYGFNSNSDRMAEISDYARYLGVTSRKEKGRYYGAYFAQRGINDYRRHEVAEINRYGNCFSVYATNDIQGVRPCFSINL